MLQLHNQHKGVRRAAEDGLDAFVTGTILFKNGLESSLVTTGGANLQRKISSEESEHSVAYDLVVVCKLCDP